MADEQRNLEVVGRIGERWNAGDHEGVLDLYHDDIVMTAAPDWPDPGPWVGKEQVAWNQREWRAPGRRSRLSSTGSRRWGTRSWIQDVDEALRAAGIA